MRCRTATTIHTVSRLGMNPLRSRFHSMAPHRRSAGTDERTFVKPGVERDVDPRMAELLRDTLRMHTHLQCERRLRVAQIVQADP